MTPRKAFVHAAKRCLIILELYFPSGKFGVIRIDQLDSDELAVGRPSALAQVMVDVRVVDRQDGKAVMQSGRIDRGKGGKELEFVIRGPGVRPAPPPGIRPAS